MFQRFILPVIAGLLLVPLARDKAFSNEAKS